MSTQHLQHCKIKHAIITILNLTFLVVITVTPIAAQVTPPPGFEFIKVTDDELNEAWFRMNDCGEVVFTMSRDGTSEGTELMLYDNGRLTQLTLDLYLDRLPEINANGSITWSKDDFSDDIGNDSILIDICISKGTTWVMSMLRV